MAARRRLEALRRAFNGRPLLATQSGTVNWLTGGVADPIDLTAPSSPVWALDFEGGRALITSEIEAPRLVGDFAVHDHGWEVVTVPWFDTEGMVRAAVEVSGVPGDLLLSDTDELGENVRSALVTARLSLSEPEQDEIRRLGALTAHSLEAALDGWRPGVTTDFDIAAAVSDDLERHGAKAVCLIVGGDERLRRYRHPLATGEVVRDAVMAVVVARRGGLHAAATRLAVRGGDAILALVEQLDPVHRQVVGACAPGRTWGEAVDELARGYEAIGRAGAWREHFQGGPIAFEQREFELAPGQSDSPFWSLSCRTGAAIAWNPSLQGGAKIEETYLIGERGPELLTVADWPLTSQDGGLQRSRVKVLD